jgi:hypothetical protein
MHPNASLMPMATALMVGLVIGGLTQSAWGAGIGACIVLAIVTAMTDDTKR